MAQDERAALVSGANRSLGREVVRQLAEKGIAVILGHRSEEKGLKKVAEGTDGDVHARRLAVADEKGTAAPTREVEEGSNMLVRASTLPDNGPTGVFFRARRELPW